MEKIVDIIKSSFLLAAVLILGWAATNVPGTAQAVTCSGDGHSCHAQLSDGTILHLKEQDAMAY